MENELKTLIDEYGAEQFFHDDYDVEDFANGRFEIAEVDSYGGEGSGDSYWRVLKFTNIETGEVKFVNFNGWYASHYGSEFESWAFVTPKQKTITVYE